MQAGDAAQSLQTAGLLPPPGAGTPDEGGDDLPEMPDIEDVDFEEVA
jgi:hypothetical protein